MNAAVIIPTLNEEAHIGALLAQCSALPDTLVTAIVVADGGSKDETRAIVAQAAIRDARIQLLDNPRRLQSAGINDAVSSLPAAVSAFVRIDAHAAYPDDYVQRVLEALERTGADVLATRLRTQGRTPIQRAIAAAQNSRFGAGGSPHRQGGYTGWVDHGHHAGFLRATFDKLDGYDVRFLANEDAEYDVRVRRAGGRVWLESGIEVGYFPRPTFPALARQYYRYGRGRAANVMKHREVRLRQLMPPGIVMALVASLLMAFRWPVALLVPVAYLMVLALCTLVLVRQSGRGETCWALPALAVMHLCWGSGFLAGVVIDRGNGLRRTGRRGQAGESRTKTGGR